MRFRGAFGSHHGSRFDLETQATPTTTELTTSTTSSTSSSLGAFLKIFRFWDEISGGFFGHFFFSGKWGKAAFFLDKLHVISKLRSVLETTRFHVFHGKLTG